MSFVKKTLDKKEGSFCMFYIINIVTSFTVTRQDIPRISYCFRNFGILLPLSWFKKLKPNNISIYC